MITNHLVDSGFILVAEKYSIGGVDRGGVAKFGSMSTGYLHPAHFVLSAIRPQLYPKLHNGVRPSCASLVVSIINQECICIPPGLTFDVSAASGSIYQPRSNRVHQYLNHCYLHCFWRVSFGRGQYKWRRRQPPG